MLQLAILHRARDLGFIGTKPQAAVDSTGFETRHVSRYYAYRVKAHFQREFYRGWPKLSIACHCQSHLIAAARVTHGPSADYTEFIPLLRQGRGLIPFDQALADAGYDSESNHRVAREQLKIRSTVIPAIRRPLRADRRKQRKWAQGKYRRQMQRRFHKRIYGQRSQVECVFSRIKRLLGSALKARRWEAQLRECQLRVLTFNLMLVAAEG